MVDGIQKELCNFSKLLVVKKIENCKPIGVSVHSHCVKTLKTTYSDMMARNGLLDCTKKLFFFRNTLVI